MLSTDLSNIWCSVSLPDLLREEKDIFDAHLTLGGGVLKEQGFLSFVTSGNQAAMLEKIQLLAKKVQAHSHCLVVVGGGLTAMGVQAALDLTAKKLDGIPLVFCGEDYSSRRWLKVAAQLEDTDFSVLALSPLGSDPAALITLRALRRIMEGRYGEGMKERIFVSCPQKGALYETALAEGYTYLPMPDCGGSVSSLNPAGLFMLEAAGLDCSRVLVGAATMAELCDLRSFENPVWLYVGARLCLFAAGFTEEVLCTTDPAMEHLARWWQKTMQAACGSKNKWHFGHMCLPADIPVLGNAVLAPGRFMTVPRVPLSARRIAVEMDWKDADGLNTLAGKDLSHVEHAAVEAALDAFARQDIPVVSISCEKEPGEKELGEMLYFVELSAALCAGCVGAVPFRGDEMHLFYRQLAADLDWNFSNM